MLGFIIAENRRFFHTLTEKKGNGRSANAPAENLWGLYNCFKHQSLRAGLRALRMAAPTKEPTSRATMYITGLPTVGNTKMPP